MQTTLRAGCLGAMRLRQLGDAGVDFAFESTLSSRTFAPFLQSLKKRGYRVVIYYFSLANAQLAVRRVKLRVGLGGHDVPADVVKRRFGRSLSNFFTLYASPELPLADEWTLFDNTNTVEAVRVAALLNNELNILEPKTWQKLQKLSKAT